MTGSYRGSGEASFHPQLLLGIMVYDYATGMFSSRKLERATYDSVAFRFVAANEHPDHDTLAAFRHGEGEVNEMHVGLKGTMNALFLKDLGLKTHLDLRGRAEAGKSAVGPCFGYRPVRTLRADGDVSRGDRTIEPTEAATIRRIFQMFADGMSPSAIAKALNAKGVLGPKGHAWRDTIIRGHADRCTGILRNELYVGRLVWNRMHFMKDPATGKRVSRMNSASEWVVHGLPEWRVVDDALWERVQARLSGIRQASGANAADRPHFWEARRSQNLLTGKFFCEPW